MEPATDQRRFLVPKMRPGGVRGAVTAHVFWCVIILSFTSVCSLEIPGCNCQLSDCTPSVLEPANYSKSSGVKWPTACEFLRQDYDTKEGYYHVEMLGRRESRESQTPICDANHLADWPRGKNQDSYRLLWDVSGIGTCEDYFAQQSSCTEWVKPPENYSSSVSGAPTLENGITWLVKSMFRFQNFDLKNSIRCVSGGQAEFYLTAWGDNFVEFSPSEFESESSLEKLGPPVLTSDNWTVMNEDLRYMCYDRPADWESDFRPTFYALFNRGAPLCAAEYTSKNQRLSYEDSLQAKIDEQQELSAVGKSKAPLMIMLAGVAGVLAFLGVAALFVYSKRRSEPSDLCQHMHDDKSHA